MHVSRDNDESLEQFVEKLPKGEDMTAAGGLTSLYFQAYPTHSGAELHYFFGAHGIGMVLTETDRERNERGTQQATAFLKRKIWESLSGDSLA